MPNPTVLISDDDPLVLRSLARLAEQAGLGVVLDGHGQVLELAAKHNPDLILLDIHQDGADGRNLLIHLKENPKLRHIEVVVMSGVEKAYTRNECLALGALEFFAKPFDRAWVEKVAELARNAQAQRSSSV